MYRLLFRPLPALDVDSGLPRGQEPWGRLGTSSLFRLEVRGPVRGMGGCYLPLGGCFLWVQKGAPLIIPSSFWGMREGPGSLRLVWAAGRQDGDLCSSSEILAASHQGQWVGQVGPEGRLDKGLPSSWWGSFPAVPLHPAPQELLLAPALLEQLTCAPGSRELGRILTVPRGQQPALQGYRDAVCSGQAAARARRFSGLASELRKQLDAGRIAQQVRRSRLGWGSS